MNIATQEMLLRWISAKGSTSGIDFRESSARIGGDGYQDMEDLSRLGHIEVVAERVYAMPPTVVWSASTEPWIVFGARSKELFDSLNEAGVSISVRPTSTGPDLWAIDDGIGQVTEKLKTANLPVVSAKDRFDDVLRALPTCQAICSALVETCLPVHGVSWTRFGRPAEVGSSPLDQPGLYATKERPKRYLYVPEEGPACDVPRHYRHILRWAEAARSMPLDLGFDAANEILRVPVVGSRLPLIIDRALRVCSGCNPERTSDGTTWQYSRIPRKRAELVARVLGVPLKRGQI
jgi:hypothetical protein